MGCTFFTRAAAVLCAAALGTGVTAVGQASPPTPADSQPPGSQLHATPPDVVTAGGLAVTGDAAELEELAAQHPMLSQHQGGDVEALLGDFDGDGTPDRAVPGSSPGAQGGDYFLNCWVEFELSSKGGEKVRQDVDVADVRASFAIYTCPELAVTDFDGDGADEVFMYRVSQTRMTPIQGATDPLVVRPDGVTTFPLKTHSFDDIDYLEFGDVNNDGRTDVLGSPYEWPAPTTTFTVWLTPESGVPNWDLSMEPSGILGDVADVDPTRPGDEVVYTTGRSGCTAEVLDMRNGQRRVIATRPQSDLCPTASKVVPPTKAGEPWIVLVRWVSSGQIPDFYKWFPYQADQDGTFRQIEQPAPEARFDRVKLTPGTHTQGCIPVTRNDRFTLGADIILTKEPEKGTAKVTSRNGVPCVFYEWTHPGTGNDLFEYKLDSASGESVSMKVRIESFGDLPPAPVAHDDEVTLAYGRDELACLPLLDNDEYTENTTLTVTSKAHIGLVHDIRKKTDGTPCVLYDRRGLESGTDRFEYALVNSGRTSEPASVTVTMTGERQPPMPVDDVITLDYDSVATECIRVMDNDENSWRGYLGIAQQPQHGEARVDAVGRCIYYTASDASVVEDEFKYVVRADYGEGEATVRVVRTGTPPTAPVVADDE